MTLASSRVTGFLFELLLRSLFVKGEHFFLYHSLGDPPKVSLTHNNQDKKYYNTTSQTNYQFFSDYSSSACICLSISIIIFAASYRYLMTSSSLQTCRFLPWKILPLAISSEMDSAAIFRPDFQRNLSYQVQLSNIQQKYSLLCCKALAVNLFCHPRRITSALIPRKNSQQSSTSLMLMSMQISRDF